MNRRLERVVMWLALAVAFGAIGWLEYKQGEVSHTLQAPPPTPAAPVSAPSSSSAAVWQGLLTLDGLEGQWVGEHAPAPDDSGAMPVTAPFLSFSQTGTGRRWVVYASLGSTQLHCSLLGQAHDGSFPGACGSQTVSFRFQRSSEGLLSFDNYSAIFRRP